MARFPTLQPSSERAATLSRTIIQADALTWLDEHSAEPHTSVITSLPDVTELPGRDLGHWRRWFGEAARRVLRWVPDDGVAVFHQSDIQREGRWIDKGYLVSRAAEDEGVPLLWHKIVCRKPPGSLLHGRASYSHLLCFSREVRAPIEKPTPDVLADAGFMPWSKATGVASCALACTFIQAQTTTRLVVDPFCGSGTILAVAGLHGFDTIGIDVSARRCRAARKLVLPEP